jgi:hypothetical protein
LLRSKWAAGKALRAGLAFPNLDRQVIEHLVGALHDAYAILFEQPVS